MSHPMNVTEVFLIAMAIIFSIPYLIWRLGKTDYWAPLVVVQILVGIVLGPSVLGAIFPDYYQFVFSPPVIQSMNGISWWAAMIFIMIAGVELDLKKVWEYRRESGVTASLALGMPLLFGCGAAVFLLYFADGWKGQEVMSWQFILGVGMACAVTAMPVLIMLMDNLNILRQPLGQRIMRYASLDDLAIWGVLALILLDWERVGRQALFLAGFAAASYLFRKLMVRLQERDRWYVAFIWLALCGYFSDWSGLHYMVGAFLAGATMDTDWFNQEDMDKLRYFVLIALMPVFFLSTGLRTHWDIGGAAVAVAALVLLLASLAGKYLGVYAAGKILKWGKGEVSVITWLLQTKGLVMIVFANVLLDKNIITNQTFTALLLMAVVSTMLTVPVVAPKLLKMKEIIYRIK
ncbi:MAG TPA: cation:proton antiporter [Cellvibrio sp.]|nr:cation:proton antiporter [Cellvibrio sp.]